jgi:hypothetical protein
MVEIEVKFHEGLTSALVGSQLREEGKISAAARNRDRIQVHLVLKALML